MTDVKIEPVQNGMNFMQYLGEIFVEHGIDFGKMLCENKMCFETERSLVFELEDAIGNKKELEITLRDLE